MAASELQWELSKGAECRWILPDEMGGTMTTTQLPALVAPDFDSFAVRQVMAAFLAGYGDMSEWGERPDHDYRRERGRSRLDHAPLSKPGYFL